jgi:hypothetical protein
MEKCQGRHSREIWHEKCQIKGGGEEQVDFLICRRQSTINFLFMLLPSVKRHTIYCFLLTTISHFEKNVLLFQFIYCFEAALHALFALASSN